MAKYFTAVASAKNITVKKIFFFLMKKYNAVNLIDINNYFDKKVITIILIEKVKKVKTKNNKDMYFITGSDETNNLEFILFSDTFCDIIIGSVYIVEGRVEKRFDKYQIVINRMKKVDNEK